MLAGLASGASHQVHDPEFVLLVVECALDSLLSILAYSPCTTTECTYVSLAFCWFHTILPTAMQLIQRK